jgi:hypothetical protein
MNREGLTDPHYLSPLASEHALDNYYGDQQTYLDATRAEEEANDAEEESGTETPDTADSQSTAGDGEG